jgi:pimeloyl-ACP methyl ester carboxylesterase
MVLYVLVGLVVLGAGYSNVKSVVDGRNHPPPGALVAVGGHRLHLHCEGSGAPTVVLEAGAGALSLSMRKIQDALRDSVRVCAYDRAGLGWSESSDSDFDAASSVAELRALVDSAGIARPFVLVGHSLGANIAQIYGASHTADLAGVVLIDPSTPDDLLEDFEGPDSLALATSGCGWKCGMASGMARLGVIRLATRRAGRTRFSEADARAYRAGIARPRHNRAALGSLLAGPKTGAQTQLATQFGDLPVTVLFTEKTRGPSGKETEADVAIWHALKLQQMRTLLAGTTRGRGPIVVPNATHVSVTLEAESARLIAAETLRLIRTGNGN